MHAGMRLDGLPAAGTRRAYRTGQALFREGDPPGPVFVLAEGRVDVEVLTPSGRPVLLAVKRPGDLVGELAAILGTDRSATATAREPVAVDVVAPDAFREALAEQPELMASVLAQLAHDVRAVGAQHVRRSEGSVTHRVAAGLLSLAARSVEHEGANDVTTIRIGHEDLAAWVGASREAVSRSLGELRRIGAVETGRRCITIPDLAVLRRHADDTPV